MNKRKIMILASAILIGSIGASGCSFEPSAPEQNTMTANATHLSGISIKRLTAGTNASSKEYVIMSYSLVPENTTHTEISISARWKNSAEAGNIDVNDYVDYEIDCTNQTFKVTKLEDFSHVIEIVLSDPGNASTNAVVEIHLQEKFLGFNSNVGPGIKSDYQGFTLTNGSFPGFTANAVINSKTNGFSDDFTDSISHQVSVSNVSIDLIEFRYRDGAMDQTLMQDLSDAIETDLKAAFNYSGFIGGNTLDSEDVTLLFTQNTNKLSVAENQLLHSKTAGIYMDLGVSFDATIAGESRSDLEFWYILKIPYSCYEDATDFPLQSISAETTTYSF